MTARRRLRVGYTAAQQVAEIHAWWTRSRPAAPNLFLDELSGAYEWVRLQPHAGQAVAGAKSAKIRRVRLRRSRYYVYYQESDDGETIDVFAVWHTSRGTEPQV